MSGFGDKAVQLAGRIADVYMYVQPNADFVRLYRDSAGVTSRSRVGSRSAGAGRGHRPQDHAPAVAERPEFYYEQVLPRLRAG